MIIDVLYVDVIVEGRLHDPILSATQRFNSTWYLLLKKHRRIEYASKLLYHFVSYANLHCEVKIFQLVYRLDSHTC